VGRLHRRPVQKVVSPAELLSTTGYLLLYEKSFPESVYMIQILCEELAQVGLHLNGTCADCVPEFVTINCKTLDVLASDALL